MTEAAGRLVGGRYRLVEAIGRGGMGRVWRAHDEVLDRDVAVKEVLFEAVPPELRGELIARTEREARTAARLRHPGIVTVHDVTEYEGAPWIVMEFVSGPSLAGLLAREGRLSWERTAAIAATLADALGHAHAAGVVHRDLKPDNVLLAGDRPVITDFGIARVMDSTQQLTRTNTVIGTPQFMPPEQLEGADVDAAADMWALGATLYAMVEGRPPFDGPSLTAVIVAVLTRPLPRAANAGPLAELLSALLSKSPQERPDAAATAELLARLRGTPSGPVGKTGPTMPTGPAGSVGPSGALSAPPVPTVVDRPAAVPTASDEPLHSLPTVSAPPAAPAPAPAESPASSPARGGGDGRPSRRKLLIGGLAAALGVGGASFAAVELVSRSGKGDAGDEGKDAGKAGDGPFESTPFLSLRGPEEDISCLEFSPDGRTVAAGTPDSTVFLWTSADFATEPVADTLETKKYNSLAVAFSPDGRTLASAGNDRTIRLWDTTTHQVRGTLTVPAAPLVRGSDSVYVSVLAFSRDGTRLAAAGGATSTVWLWDVRARKLVAALEGIGAGVSALAFSPDGKRLVAGTFDEGVMLSDLAAPGRRPVVLRDAPEDRDGWMLGVAFSRDGTKVYGLSEDLEQWDVATRRRTAFTGFNLSARGVAFSTDGRTAVTAGSSLQVWDPATRTERQLVTETARAETVALSPDGRTIAIGRERGVDLYRRS
ncbi:WD40 repeat domain-containing serine/threonine protein kinase [Streptomyces sp. NPDC015130]|uniref:WD40 repeat domain-containing serine/threonine protein kinase n=1 Tax=Streptomyces sp. NPDC015130 TaxID=3364940 RepID=UPI0036F4C485